MKERQGKNGSDLQAIIDQLRLLLQDSLAVKLSHFPESVIDRWINAGIRTKIRRLEKQRGGGSLVAEANKILRRLDDDALQRLAIELKK